MLTSSASANSQREFKRPANHMTQLHYETNHPVLTGRAVRQSEPCRLIPGMDNPFSQSVQTPASHSSQTLPCPVPLTLSLSAPHHTSPLQFYLPPRRPAVRSFVGG